MINLNIGDIIIKMQSRFKKRVFTKEEKQLARIERYSNFLYYGNRRPDIIIDVKVVSKLPKTNNAETLFVVTHPDNTKSWSFFKKGGFYIYKSLLEGKEQVMRMNSSFDRVDAFVLPQEDKIFVWNFIDIIYDFLQVLLINYLAAHRKGIIAHGFAVKDLDGRGLLFAGKSRSGKSTSARIWYNHSKAIILNDDRVIVRRIKGRFFIYGSPWHGNFEDYLDSRIEKAPLSKLFFIRHASKNNASLISGPQAFKCLYPAIFPAFWDKNTLDNTVSFCHDLVDRIPCVNFGFVKDKSIIGVARHIDEYLKN